MLMIQATEALAKGGSKLAPFVALLVQLEGGDEDVAGDDAALECPRPRRR